MTFWWATLSALVAAIAAGIVLKLIFKKKNRKMIGGTQIDRSNVKDSEIESKVKAKHTNDYGAGNIDISNSQISGSKIKGDVTLDE